MDVRWYCYIEDKSIRKKISILPQYLGDYIYYRVFLGTKKYAIFKNINYINDYIDYFHAYTTKELFVEEPYKKLNQYIDTFSINNSDDLTSVKTIYNCLFDFIDWYNIYLNFSPIMSYVDNDRLQRTFLAINDFPWQLVPLVLKYASSYLKNYNYDNESYYDGGKKYYVLNNDYYSSIAIILSIITGLSIDEIELLQVKDVDFESEELHIPSDNNDDYVFQLTKEVVDGLGFIARIVNNEEYFYFRGINLEEGIKDITKRYFRSQVGHEFWQHSGEKLLYLISSDCDYVLQYYRNSSIEFYKEYIEIDCLYVYKDMNPFEIFRDLIDNYEIPSDIKYKLEETDVNMARYIKSMAIRIQKEDKQYCDFYYSQANLSYGIGEYSGYYSRMEDAIRCGYNGDYSDVGLAYLIGEDGIKKSIFKGYNILKKFYSDYKMGKLDEAISINSIILALYNYELAKVVIEKRENDISDSLLATIIRYSFKEIVNLAVANNEDLNKVTARILNNVGRTFCLGEAYIGGHHIFIEKDLSLGECAIRLSQQVE